MEAGPPSKSETRASKVHSSDFTNKISGEFELSSKVLEKKTRNPNKRAHQSFYDVVHQKVFEDMKKMPTRALKE